MPERDSLQGWGTLHFCGMRTWRCVDKHRLRRPLPTSHRGAGHTHVGLRGGHTVPLIHHVHRCAAAEGRQRTCICNAVFPADASVPIPRSPGKWPLLPSFGLMTAAERWVLDIDWARKRDCKGWLQTSYSFIMFMFMVLCCVLLYA